jgi:hypothetical protein
MPPRPETIDKSRVTRDGLRNEMLQLGNYGFSTIQANLLIFRILEPHCPGSPIALN